MTPLLPAPAPAPAARMAELRAVSRRPALAPAPPGAVYDLDRPSERVARELAERGVIVRAGAEYGPSGEGHVRISFAASEDDLRTGLARIVRYVEDQRARQGNRASDRSGH